MNEMSPEHEESDDRRLFGLDGAEHLHWAAADCYETDIDPEVVDGEYDKVTIEEWTVVPTINHLPTADHIAEWVSEWVADSGEVNEDVSEIFDRAIDGSKAEISAVLAVIAAKVNGGMADRLVGRHEITWDSDGEPLLDGEPLYRTTLLVQCERCEGCGQIADSDEGEPWIYWTDLPVRSAIAVIAGIVKPIPCPSCDGSGEAVAVPGEPEVTG